MTIREFSTTWILNEGWNLKTQECKSSYGMGIGQIWARTLDKYGGRGQWFSFVIFSIFEASLTSKVLMYNFHLYEYLLLSFSQNPAVLFVIFFDMHHLYAPNTKATGRRISYAVLCFKPSSWSLHAFSHLHCLVPLLQREFTETPLLLLMAC